MCTTVPQLTSSFFRPLLTFVPTKQRRILVLMLVIALILVSLMLVIELCDVVVICKSIVNAIVLSKLIGLLHLLPPVLLNWRPVLISKADCRSLVVHFSFQKQIAVRFLCLIRLLGLTYFIREEDQCNSSSCCNSPGG